MCGPLSLILYQNQNKSEILGISTIYNLSRSFSYFTIGILLGFLGRGLDLFFFRGFTFFLGIFFLVVFSLGSIFPKFQLHISYSFFPKFFRNAKSQYGKAFLLGSFTGLIPCGLLYPAYSLAILAKTPLESGLAMLSFSLGTYPALFLVSTLYQKFSTRIQSSSLRILIAVSLLSISLALLYFRYTIHPEIDETCDPLKSLLK